MSGLFDKAKKSLDPDMVDKAADVIEEQVTDERVDEALEKVPSADKVSGQVPDDIGKKAADATRGLLGDKDDEQF